MIDEKYAYLYSVGYYSVLFALTLFLSLYYSRRRHFVNTTFTWVLGTAVILFLAFRPLTVSHGFGDTRGYAFFFNLMKSHKTMNMNAGDIGFEFISFYLRQYDVWVLFFFMGCIYVIPQILACKKLSPEHYGIMFFIVVCSFSYWGYGVNGMRNGAALSLVLLGITCSKKIYTLIFFLLGYTIHGSAIIPITAYCITYLYRNSKVYLAIWCICIVISYFTNDMLTNVFDLDKFVNDERVNYLTSEFNRQNKEIFSSTGYRFDFLIYSAIPIIIGSVNIFKKKVTNKIYITIYNIYLITNAFWLFAIYLPYNNRFAYLSWFLYPILISYPFLQPDKPSLSDSRNTRIIIFLNYMFTFFMWSLS